MLTIDSRGFTLVEIVVALLLLSVGLLGTLSAFTTSARSLADAHSSFELSANAAKLLERARAEACGIPSAGTGTAGSLTFRWDVETISDESRNVTVVVSTVHPRVRIDTFSAVIAC